MADSLGTPALLDLPDGHCLSVQVVVNVEGNPRLRVSSTRDDKHNDLTPLEFAQLINDMADEVNETAGLSAEAAQFRVVADALLNDPDV